MKKMIRLAAVCAAALWLAAYSGGCATPWGMASKNIENSRNLRVGMTKSEVLEVMGEPIRDEKFCEPDLWFYYIEMVWGDGLVTPEECLPLVFEDGKLIGWGNNFYLDRQIQRRKEDPGADLAQAEAEKAEAAKAKAEQAKSEPAKSEAEQAKPEPARPAVPPSGEAGKSESDAGTSVPGKK